MNKYVGAAVAFGGVLAAIWLNKRKLASSSKQNEAKTLTLNSGFEMPLVGLGTWMSKPGQVEIAVYEALKIGYKAIDCAHVYGNENEVGAGLARAIKEGICKREDIFITSKLWNTEHDPKDVLPAIQLTLKNLGLDYLDLYLIHWPIAFRHSDDGSLMPTKPDGTLDYTNPPLTSTWAEMEKLVDAKLTRSIGVSNFNSQQIDKIIANSRITPAMNQIEVHAYLNQADLVDFCRAKGIHITGYSPLSNPGSPFIDGKTAPQLLKDPVVARLAQKYNVTPAQILIRFAIERQIVVIPKSVTPSRIASNFDVYSFKLSQEEIDALFALNINFRGCNPMVEVDGKKVPRDKGHPEYPFSILF